MRLLTKAEACRELRFSLSTLNRRIAAGEVQVKREPRGRRHRVSVMLYDDPPVNADAPDLALSLAQERIRGLEEHVELLQEQLDLERRRNAELANQLTAAQTSGTQNEHRPWWRFWQSWRWENRRATQQDG